jgi:hypothetical protein
LIQKDSAIHIVKAKNRLGYRDLRIQWRIDIKMHSAIANIFTDLGGHEEP